MTPNDSDSNQSRFDSSEQSPAKDRMRAIAGKRQNARKPGPRREQERVSRHDCCILINSRKVK